MAEHIVDRRVSPDGKKALCILQRDDGFFCFREDRLFENKEFEPYWIDGYPASGLYATIAEAEGDARRKLDWLTN